MLGSEKDLLVFEKIFLFLAHYPRKLRTISMTKEKPKQDVTNGKQKKQESASAPFPLNL